MNYGHSAPKDKVGLDTPALAWGKCVGFFFFVCVCLCGGGVEEEERGRSSKVSFCEKVNISVEPGRCHEGQRRQRCRTLGSQYTGDTGTQTLLAGPCPGTGTKSVKHSPRVQPDASGCCKIALGNPMAIPCVEHPPAKGPLCAK